MSETSHIRTIRSFVLRQGRITPSQQAAFDHIWPTFGLNPDARFDQLSAFGRLAPLIVEIGFGNGESLAQMASWSPQKDFVGIEVHRPGVGRLLLKLQEIQLNNVRVYCSDAVDIFRNVIANGSLDGIQVFFPDPWQKKRHHKRRLINAEFVRSAATKLKAGGTLHCATDWEEYASQMLAVLESESALTNLAGNGQFAERPSDRPLTKFEKRGQRLGHEVWDLIFERNDLEI